MVDLKEVMFLLKVTSTLNKTKTVYHFMYQDLKTYLHRLSGHEDNFMVGSVIFRHFCFRDVTKYVLNQNF